MNAKADTHLVGEQLVVPACGVGTVEGVESLTLEGQTSEFYHISLPDGSDTWVPLDQLEAQGLRPIMDKKTARKSLKAVKDEEAPEKRATWNRRQRRYRETLIENQPLGIAAMVGELGAVLKEKGRLSFSERKMFDQAMELLATELGLSLDLTQEQALLRLNKAMEIELKA